MSIELLRQQPYADLLAAPIGGGTVDQAIASQQQAALCQYMHAAHHRAYSWVPWQGRVGEVVLILPLRGAISWRDANQRLDCAAGNMLLMRQVPGTSYLRQSFGSGYECWWFIASGCCVEAYAEQLAPAGGAVIEAADHPAAIHAFAHVCLQAARGVYNLSPEQAVNAAADVLRVYMHSAQANNYETLYQRARSFIRQHLTNPDLSLKFICRHLGCSQATLTRHFKQESDTSVYQYITQQRMQQARAVLLNTESIKEAAQACGFALPRILLHALKNFTI